MQSLQNISKSAVARTIALSFVLAVVVVGTSLTHAALDVNQTHNFTVRVFQGDPAQNVLVPGVSVSLSTSDSSNPSNGISGSTDGSGSLTFTDVHEGEFTVNLSKSGFDSRTYNIILDSDTTLEASMISNVPPPPPAVKTYNFTVRVFDGDPAQNILVPSASVNLSNGTSGLTNGSGTVSFNVTAGTYAVVIGENLTNYYSRTYNVIIDSDTTLEASLVNKTTPPGTGGSTGACLPTPPDGKPLLNIWPISESGATCTDYHFLAVKNATAGSGYVTGNGTVTASDGQVITVELYVHNGTLDYPENIAHNVQVQSTLPSGSGAVTAQAWADNADAITSAQKGGDVNVALGANQHLEYLSGSTKLYDNTGAFQSALPDGITGSGVSIGDMRGCFQFLHFVTYQAKVVTTTTPPPPPTPTPTPVNNLPGGHLDVANCSTIGGWATDSDSPNSAVAVKIFDGISSNGKLIATVSANQFRSDVGNHAFSLNMPTSLKDGAVHDIWAYAVDVQTSELNPIGDIVFDSSACIPPTPNPTISIAKKVRDVTLGQTTFAKSINANPNDVLEYKIVVSSANATADAVVLTDSMPQGMSFLGGSLTIDGTANSSTPDSVSLGNIGAGQSKTIVFRETLSSASFFSIGQTVLTNTATAKGSNTNTVSDTANVVVTQNPVSPVLSIQKTVKNITAGQTSYVKSTTANPSDVVEYKIVVTNSSATANSVVLNDSIPVNLSYVSGSLTIDGTANSSTPDSVPLGNMNAGQSRTIIFRENLASASSFNVGQTVLTNTATASGTNTNQVMDTANIVVTKNVVNQNTTLSISKTVSNLITGGGYSDSASANVGDELNYKIVVVNTGSNTANNVTISDFLPSGINYDNALGVSGSSFTGSINAAPFLKVTTLPSGQSLTITFNAKVDSTACNKTSTNTAFASADNAPQVSDTAFVAVNCNVITNPNLVFSKIAWNDTLNKDATTTPARAGDVITYTLTVKNTGNGVFSNFTFTDNISNVLQLANVTDIDGASLVNGVLTFPAIDVPANSVINRGFKVQIKSALPTSGACVITNTFGNTVNVSVSGCTTVPFVAPKTGPTATASMVLAGLSVLGVALYRRDKFSYLAKLTGFARS